MAASSHDPADYQKGPHYRRRTNERGIPDHVVSQVIEEGEPAHESDKHDEGVRLRAKVGSVWYYVVIVPGRGIVKTAGMCG